MARIETAGQNTRKRRTYREKKVYECSNLRILTEFMKIMNINTPELADRIGVTRQVVYKWLSKDNIRLSNLEKIFESYGFKTVCYFEKPAEKPRKTAAITPARHKYEKPRRLLFLYNTIHRMGLSDTELSRLMNISLPAIGNCMKNDDIYISRLEEISTCLGLPLHINIIPEDGKTNEDTD